MSAFPRWLGRKAALFAILVLAVTFFTLVWPSLSGERLASELMSPQAMRDELSSARAAAQQNLDGRVQSLRGASETEQRQRLGQARTEIDAAKRELGEFGGLLDGVRPSRVLQQKRLELRISGLGLEIAALEQLAKENGARNALLTARRKAQVFSRVPTAEAVRQAQVRCRSATAALQRFNQRWPLDRLWRDVISDERRRLQATEQRACATAKRAEVRRRTGLDAARAAREAQQRYDQARKWVPGTVADVSENIPAKLLRNIVQTALVLFALILALPLLIRCLFYFVLAPIAEKRPPIRLLNGTNSRAAIPVAGTSRTSVPIELGEREELLVRQGFLQSTSEVGSKSTLWLLDWRHPLSSIASGLTFLTRIQGAGSRTVVSAVSDPFAEVTILTLSRGASCVLHPRALAAVVQRIGEPLKITRHWRLASLHAWLTLQLRYLAFHGPAQLVIKGSRGVRVEPAGSGRIFGQQQLVGFSTQLAYSVTRTETFWPYLLGREQLLKDRVYAGEGVLIVEEAPMSGRHVQGVRGRLEGAFDASLKAFGL